MKKIQKKKTRTVLCSRIVTAHHHRTITDRVIIFYNKKKKKSQSSSIDEIRSHFYTTTSSYNFSEEGQSVPYGLRIHRVHPTTTVRPPERSRIDKSKKRYYRDGLLLRGWRRFNFGESTSSRRTEMEKSLLLQNETVSKIESRRNELFVMILHVFKNGIKIIYNRRKTIHERFRIK